MGENLRFGTGARGAAFERDERRVVLQRMFGLPGRGDVPEFAGGDAVVRTLDGVYEAEALALAECRATDELLATRWRVGESGLELSVTWRYDAAADVFTRQDVLTNVGTTGVTVLRARSRMTLAVGRYEAYTEVGRWGAEDQGHWTALHSGELVLRNYYGRTTRGNTPFVGLRDIELRRGLTLSLVPEGDWQIVLRAVGSGPQAALLTVEWGPQDEELKREMAPGEAWELPGVILTNMPDGQVETAAPALHQHVLRTMFAKARRTMPLIYNTWFDQADNIEPERLRRQLAAAKEIGCEVFVIDAGWFGKGRGEWFDETGHWHESTTVGFGGKLREFADEVRAAGLGFGLWMEAEHAGPKAPVRAEHPEWFVGGAIGGAAKPGRGPRLDLENPAAYAWLRAEIGRVIETYQLAWIKLDSNIDFGHDARGRALAGYYERWFALLDELRAAYPRTVFEGCSSGALRLDLNVLRHHDAHFLSDCCNTLDQLRIGEAALLRLPPGRLERWLVIRSLGHTVPDYPLPAAEARESVGVPGQSGWVPNRLTESVDVDLATVVAMVGTMGVSGDLAGLGEEVREQLLGHMTFWKRWREFILASRAVLLTPVRSSQDNTGWACTQLIGAGPEQCLVFACRLQDAYARRHFPLSGLDAARRYRVTVHPKGEAFEADGKELMTLGLAARLDMPGTACVYVVEAMG